MEFGDDEPLPDGEDKARTRRMWWVVFGVILAGYVLAGLWAFSAVGHAMLNTITRAF